MASLLPTIGEIAFSEVMVGESGDAPVYLFHVGDLTEEAARVFAPTSGRSGKGSSHLSAVEGFITTELSAAFFGNNPANRIYVGRIIAINGTTVNGTKGWFAWACSRQGHGHKTPRLFFVRGGLTQDRDPICDHTG